MSDEKWVNGKCCEIFRSNHTKFDSKGGKIISRKQLLCTAHQNDSPLHTTASGKFASAIWTTMVIFMFHGEQRGSTNLTLRPLILFINNSSAGAGCLVLYVNRDFKAQGLFPGGCCSQSWTKAKGRNLQSSSFSETSYTLRKFEIVSTNFRIGCAVIV
ncbi:hypothetical protein DL98DRAFT_52456 [Cadophora sp. DSE1049]|nr:hypothetical protein DL98DRAFT_52456 [Cadophora sp. DSE1049]